MAYFATSPEWKAVPQATTKTLSTDWIRSSAIDSSSSSRRPSAPSRARSVSARASGCSWISFSMKSSKPPFCARPVSQSTVIGAGSTGLPSKSVIDVPSGVNSTTCPSAMGTTVRVRSSTAGMSDASIASPSPSPTTSGEDSLAPTIRSGSSAESATIA